MKELPYKFGYSICPWDLFGLVSTNARAALEKIYQCVYMNCHDLHNGVEIPAAWFNPDVAEHRNTINNAISELIQFNIIRVDKTNRQKHVYYINWEELDIIHRRLIKFNKQGRAIIRQLVQKMNQPVSLLPQSQFDTIVTDEKLVQKLNQFAVTRSEIEPVLENSFKNCTSLNNTGLICERVDDLPAFINIETGSENERVFNELVQKLNEFYAQLRFILDSYSISNLHLAQINGKYELVQFLNENSFIFCTSFQKLVQKLYTDNIEGKKTKKMSDERSESYIGGEKEKIEIKIKNKNFEVFSSKDKNEENDDIDISQENLKINDDLTSRNNQNIQEDEERELTDEELEEKSRRRKERYKAKKASRLNPMQVVYPDSPYNRKPYFPVTEIREFADNSELAVESPVKLFIWNLYGQLTDYKINDHYENLERAIQWEQDNDILPANTDEDDYFPSFEEMCGLHLYFNELEKIANVAMEETKGQVEKGMVDSEAQPSVNFKIEDLQQINWRYLCDWEEMSAKGFEGFVKIRFDRFRNIEAPDIEGAQAEQDEDGYSSKARNIQYAAYLVKTDISQLTKIEGLQRQFLDTYVKLSDIFTVEHYKDFQGAEIEQDLAWSQIVPFIARLDGDVREYFFRTVTCTPGFKHGMAMLRRDAVFSYKESQDMDRLLGEESQATTDNLTKILPNPFY